MVLQETKLEGVYIIEPKVFGDNRGWFMETYSKDKFKELGINIDFIQDNHSFSSEKGILRGLHFQTSPKAQSKLIRCTRGTILDVVVDLRKGSSTYKQWVIEELSETNKKQVFIPKGCAHGFLTLTDDVDVQYKVDEYYSPECDRSIRFDDPEIGVQWGIENPILSEKDEKAPLLKDSDVNFSIKVLVTGAKGQLGHDVLGSLDSLGIENLGIDISDLDLTDKQQVQDYIRNYNPDVIVHCAAYTAVDKAEDEKEICYAVNAEGTRNLAEAAKAANSKLVYISTDYVFSGEGEVPHKEGETTNPVNYYGYTKEQGEKAITELLERYFIIRTSWVYGLHGNNFVNTMLKIAATKDELNVVSDQIGAPTYTKDLAQFITDLIQTNQYGIYHGVNEGYCSWYDFAKAIFEKSNIDIKVNPIPSSDYITKAKRPLNSRMSKVNIDKIGLKRFPDWEDALDRYLDEMKAGGAK